MLHSIRAKFIAGICVMAVILGAVIYFTSAQMASIQETLKHLEALQDVKSHVLIPQKDMNQFIAAMDSTELFLELNDAEGAQEAYDESVDAEQDISAEFAYLEENAPAELRPIVSKSHQDWEMATEFMKTKAEAMAKDQRIALVRPATEPTKVVDAHAEAAIASAQGEYGTLNMANLAEIQDNDDTNPVEIADNEIDKAEDATDEFLATARETGERALKRSGDTVLIGSLGALLAVVGIGGVLTMTVSRPLATLKVGAERIADGDLDYEFEDVGSDEVGSVIQSVETMSKGLKGRIRNMEELAGVVMVTADEIEADALAAKSSGADVDGIMAKVEELKGLVGQMLASTGR